MRKYLVAAVVAVMVFAFTAFAASLTVDAGTLAFGVDDVGDCGGVADIHYSHHQQPGGPGDPDFAYIDAIIVNFPAAGGVCNGFGVYMTSSVGGGVAGVENDQAVFVVTNGVDVAGTNGWDPSINPRQGVAIEDLVGDITVKVYSDVSNTGPGQFNTGQHHSTPDTYTFGAFG